MADNTVTSTAAATQAIPDYPQPRARQCPFAPAADIRDLAKHKPINRVRLWDGSTPWLVTGPDELRSLLTDPRVSSDERLPGLPHWNAAERAAAMQRPTTFLNTDGREHAHFRRMLTRSFSYKRVNALRPDIERFTNEHIDALLAGPRPADLVPALALPIPTRTICALLGTPYDDHEFFQRHTAIGVNRSSTVEESQQAFVALNDYMRRLVETKLAHPDDTVASEIAAQVKAGAIDIETGAFMGTALIAGGFETSANMISLGILALLENPEQAAIVRDTDDPAVIANAVEELLRYLAVAQNSKCRVALDDIEIAGETLRAGDGIVQGYPFANWDPTTYPQPDRLDVRRPIQRHMAFGFGPHACIGQQLARVELQVVYPTVLRRIPTLQLATTADSLDFKNDNRAYGVHAVPVTW